MNVLITGGAGFIGSHLCKELSKKHSVSVLDNLCAGKIEFVDDLDISFYEKSIVNKKSVFKIFAKHRPDAVIHLAAKHFIPDCKNNPEKTLRVNIEGMMNLVMASKEHSSYFIFASTAGLYKKQSNRVDEESPIKPNDVYGRSKQIGELLLSQTPQYTALRLFNVYGPHETHPHLIPHIINQIDNEVISLGNIKSKRDFIYVSDVVSAVKASLNKMPQNEVFNVGTGSAYNAEQITNKIARITNKNLQIETKKKFRREGDNPYLCANTEKIKSDLNWKPEVDLNTGLKKLLLTT